MKHLVENAVATAAFPDRGEKFPILGKETSLFVTSEVKTIRSSQRHGWQDIFAAHTIERPHECLHHSVPFFWLSMGLCETEVHRSIGGRGELAVLPAYSISMAEPLTAVDCLIGNPTEAVHVFLRPELLQETAYELFEIEPDRVSLLPVFGRTSTSLSWLLRAIKQSLAEPANLSQLKIDYLARALCADLLAKYSVVLPAAIKSEQYGGLTSRQLRRIDDYITEHLNRDIHIGELASLSGMGRTSFHQRFKAAMHLTPHQYVMRLRASCMATDHHPLSGEFKRLRLFSWGAPHCSLKRSTTTRCRIDWASYRWCFICPGMTRALHASYFAAMRMICSISGFL